MNPGQGRWLTADAEGLLARSESDRQRAFAITRNLCRETEASAQHETGKEEVLDKRLFDPCREAGDKRLNNLQR